MAPGREEVELALTGGSRTRSTVISIPVPPPDNLAAVAIYRVHSGVRTYIYFSEQQKDISSGLSTMVEKGSSGHI